nr:thiamine ABC transporter substrate-binding protein [Herpetosiphon giganteus]
MVLAGCGAAATPTAETAVEPTPATTAAAEVTPAATQATQAPTDSGQFAGQTLVVVSHDSFAISSEVISGFEEMTGATVQILESGDAGEALNKSILAKGAPLGDVLYGVDNTFLSRALDADIFEAYASKNLEQIPAELKLDAQNRVSPVDVGYVTINYDKAAVAEAGLSLPTDLRDLTKPEWKGKLVVENPATSSPGLSFMLATIGHFGESGEYTWRNFWSDLRANEIKVASGWEEAYYGDFSGASDGQYPLAVSYATSPAAEVMFATTPLTDAPTGNLLLPGASFQQIEFVGLLKDAKNPELGKAWIDYMLSDAFQSDIGGQMFVYPALPSAKVPAEFDQYAQVPSEVVTLAPADISANRERWLNEWQETVLR